MISVVIPAHNEARYIGRCIDAIHVAAARIEMPVEIVVCLNRCTDATEAIACDRGARVVHEDARNLAKIRNAGARAACGEILVTIDADSWMSPGMLAEVLTRLRSGRLIGGGVVTVPERMSVGIFFSLLTLVPHLWRALLAGMSAGMFWLLKRDFDALGGFDERYICTEDFDFAHRLFALGRRRGLRYGTIWKARVTTSVRKFDQFGDWYLFKNPQLVARIFGGADREAADGFYYDVGRGEGAR